MIFHKYEIHINYQHLSSVVLSWFYDMIRYLNVKAVRKRRSNKTKDQIIQKCEWEVITSAVPPPVRCYMVNHRDNPPRSYSRNYHLLLYDCRIPALIPNIFQMPN